MTWDDFGRVLQAFEACVSPLALQSAWCLIVGCEVNGLTETQFRGYLLPWAGPLDTKWLPGPPKNMQAVEQVPSVPAPAEEAVMMQQELQKAKAAEEKVHPIPSPADEADMMLAAEKEAKDQALKEARQELQKARAAAGKGQGHGGRQGAGVQRPRPVDASGFAAQDAEGREGNQ